MRRGVRLGIAGAALLAAGAAGGWFAHRPVFNASAYGRLRLAVIQQHLDEATPGFVLVTGDSNAELRSSWDRPCGSPVVNAGISGATTQVYRKLLSQLTIRARPRAAVLTIGTNNLTLKKSPRSAGPAGQFEDDVAAIVTRLRESADAVIVTALPPIDRTVGDRLDAEAVGDYSARLQTLCARIGCRYVDPFASLREGTSGYAAAGGMRDGVHLARYKPTLGLIEAVLCPAETSLKPASGAAAAP